MLRPLTSLIALLAISSFLCSCAIYLDEPYNEEFTGRVQYSDGKPAKGVTVNMRSPRDYFPLLLMLAPHQPLALYDSAETDNEGYYHFKSLISRDPVVTAMIKNEDPKNWRPKFIGGTKDIKNGIITLKPWDEDLKSRNIKQGEQGSAHQSTTR